MLRTDPLALSEFAPYIDDMVEAMIRLFPASIPKGSGDWDTKETVLRRYTIGQRVRRWNRNGGEAEKEFFVYALGML